MSPRKSSTDYERMAEQMFELDPNIRFVSVIDMNDMVIIAKIREGLTSISRQHVDDLITIFPPLIMRAVERLQPNFGHAAVITVRFDKILVALCRISDLLAIASYNPSVEIPFTSQFEQAVKRFLLAGNSG